MPIPCNMFIPDIPGSSEKEGRADSSDVFEFDHEVHMSYNATTGQMESSPIHSPLRVVKEFDKASPLLHNALCTAQLLGEVTLKFYRIDPDSRSEVEYYTIKLTKVRISQIRPYMPMTLSQANERLRHMEQVSLVYEKVEWTWLPDSVVAQYEWKAAGEGSGGDG